MQIVLEGVDPSVEVRSHPYEGSAYNDERVRHYDFVKHPKLIRSVLEDFNPWERYDSIEDFYQLLEWINGPQSIFESSDCRLETPQPNLQDDMPTNLRLNGRLMVFFRNVELNFADIVSETNYMSNQNVIDLVVGSDKYLKTVHREKWWIKLQIFLSPTIYRDGTPPLAFGQQVTFQFNCFADREQELFRGFGSVVDSLFGAMRLANDEWKLTHG